MHEDPGENADATHGFDLLGAALGRGAGPGATDLDEFVEFEIYYDGAARAAEAGEAVAFLRARLCQAFELLYSDLSKYLWHRDRLVLEVELGDCSRHDEPRLMGHLRTGDGVEDEWFVVYLLRRLTAAMPDAACRVLDADGELLLIEAALAAPRWMTPSNAENRCWLRGGAVHLLPKPRPPEPQKLPRHLALSKLRGPSGATVAKDKVQRAIDQRLEGYPRSAVELSRHVARAVLPVGVARLFLAYPQLIAVAIDHLPPPPARELVRLRRQLKGDEANLNFDCESSPEQETACVGLRFTRCQYARLQGLRFQLPQRFTAKHWRQPRGVNVEDKAMQLGATLCAGLEVAFVQGTKSATAVLRWPSPELDSKGVLPAILPWARDAAFARCAATLRPPIDTNSDTVRRAFFQQDKLDARFQGALLSALRDPKLEEAVDLNTYWRDNDDAEDWLQVSAEDLDQEMQARQAEFDRYDKRASGGSRGGEQADKAEKAAGAGKPEDLKEEVNRMGQELSGLLAKASSVDGVDTADGPVRASEGRESDSDDSSEELDVLGMEEDPASSDSEGGEGHDEEGSFREYLGELDEQLEGAFGELDAKAEAEDAPTAGGLPLSSRHVKVHDVERMDLDTHAMEHLLASYCSEQHLEPGPASLLLRELGFTTGPSRGGVAGAAEAADGLDTMD